MLLKKKNVHVCDLGKDIESVLPGLPPNASIGLRIKRLLFRILLVSENNIQAKQYLRSTAAINSEKRRHVNSKHWYIMHPFSKLRTLWERYMAFILTFSLIQIPYIAAFYTSFGKRATPQEHEGFWQGVSDFLDFACLFDVLMHFLSGYRESKTKEIVMEPRRISRHYLKGFFLVDLVSSLPMELVKTSMIRSGIIERSTGFNLVNRILSLVKVFRIKTLLLYLHQFSELMELSGLGLLIMRLGFFVTFYIHWMSCMHYFVPVLANYYTSFEDISNDSWILKYNLSDAQPLVKYAHCTLRTVSIMLAVAYGHGTPETVEDVCFCMLNLCSGFLLFTYILVAILQMRNSKLASETKYMVLINQLKVYMHHKKLPNNMQQRLISYYEYRFQRSYFREQAIMATLSDTLCQEINMHMCHKLVKNVAIFHGLKRSVIAMIVKYLRHEVYMTNDVILKAGTQGDCMYFLSSGTVCIVTMSGAEVCHLEDGAHFGEAVLVTEETNRIASVVAVSICEVYRLDRKDFHLCVEQETVLYKKLLDAAQERRQMIMEVEQNEQRRLLESIAKSWGPDL